MVGLISKHEFLDYIKFIEEKNKQQDAFKDVLEAMSPQCYCDAYIYSDYETKIVRLLEKVMHDTSNIISYKLYDYECFTEEQKADQLKETPEIKTWETVYDFLIKNMEESK